MTEPTSTAAGAAIGGGLGALSVLVLGAHLDAVLLGLFASMLATAQLDKIDSFVRALSAVFFSALASGLFSHVGAGWVAAMLPAKLMVQPDALRMPIAFLIGALMPTLWPILRRRAEHQAEKGAPK